jgi:hypothetical protein
VCAASSAWLGDGVVRCRVFLCDWLAL